MLAYAGKCVSPGRPPADTIGSALPSPSQTWRARRDPLGIVRPPVPPTAGLGTASGRWRRIGRNLPLCPRQADNPGRGGMTGPEWERRRNQELTSTGIRRRRRYRPPARAEASGSTGMSRPLPEGGRGGRDLRLSPAPLPALSLRGNVRPAARSGTRVRGHPAPVGPSSDPSLGTGRRSLWCRDGRWPQRSRLGDDPCDEENNHACAREDPRREK